MIITRSPYRISFFGGGTDYHTWYEEHTGDVLSTSINHYNYISCRYLLPFHAEYRNRISWRILEYPERIEDIQHPAIKAALIHYRVTQGVEISNQCDLPARAGLGSSSSFCAGLIKAIHALNGEMIAKYDAETCYQKLLAWAEENSSENVDYLKKDKDYVMKVLNIDREKEKPRKDIYKWSMVFDYFDYMFSAPKAYEVDESERKKFEEVLRNYKNYIDLSNKDIWFGKVKEMAEKLGYAVDNKEYKKSPEKFKGNVAKVCEFIRVAITGEKNSPDLYEIMSVLGQEKVLERISLIV